MELLLEAEWYISLGPTLSEALTQKSNMEGFQYNKCNNIF